MARISEDRKKHLSSLEEYKKQRARALQLREEQAEKLAKTKLRVYKEEDPSAKNLKRKAEDDVELQNEKRVKVQVPGDFAVATPPPSPSTKRKRLESLGDRQDRQKRQKVDEEPPLHKIVQKPRPDLGTKSTRKPLQPKPSHLACNINLSKRVDKAVVNVPLGQTDNVPEPDTHASSKSGQKRKAGGDEPRAAKVQKLDEGPRKPIGLHNFHRACYQNAIIQCLSEIPELVEYLRSKRFRILDNTELRAFSETDLTKIRGVRSQRRGSPAQSVHDAFQKSKALVSVEAYLGELLERMRTTQPAKEYVSPFLFTKALAVLDGKTFDGETSQDAWEFLMHLLNQLKAEEAKQDSGPVKNTVVEKVFEGTTSSIYKCSACAHEHKTPNDLLSLDLELPRRKDTIRLQQCVDSYSSKTFLADYKCEGCGETNTVSRTTKLGKAPHNLVIKLTRTDYKGIIRTPVRLPKLLDLDTESGIVQYKISSFVKHTGKNENDGHYIACTNVDGNWWVVDDTKVTKMSKENGTDSNASVIFLKKTGVAP